MRSALLLTLFALGWSMHAAMWKKTAIGLVGLLSVLAVVVAVQPGEFRVQRTLVLPAPPSAVYEEVVSFHNWSRWSPWDKLDPAMKREFSGPDAGVGASYHWVGNDEVGEGRMTIVEAAAPSRIEIRLEFLAPWQATNPTTFSFEPEGQGTRATWSMRGKNDFVGKAFGLFMDMDALVGGDFEKGLRALGQVASGAQPR